MIANCALTLAYFGEDLELATGLIDRALKLNPGHARGWHVSGMLRFFAGDLDATVEHVETSRRLSPRSRVGWGTTWVGAAHFLSGRLDQGAALLRLAIREDSSFPRSLPVLGGLLRTHEPCRKSQTGRSTTRQNYPCANA